MAATRRNELRDAQIFRDHLSGRTQADLAREHGISQPSISVIIGKQRANTPEDVKEDMRKDIDAWYRRMIWDMQEIADAGPMPAYSNGRPILDEDEDGNEIKVLDYSGVIKAKELQVKIQADRRKMFGLDDATKIESSGEVRHTIVGVPIEDV